MATYPAASCIEPLPMTRHTAWLLVRQSLLLSGLPCGCSRTSGARMGLPRCRCVRPRMGLAKGHHGRCPGSDGLGEDAVDVLHVHIDVHRCPTDSGWATEIHLRILIGNHYSGIADLNLGMANRPIGTGDAQQFCCIESRFVEFDGFRCPSDAEIRCNRVISLWNRLYATRHGTP